MSFKIITLTPADKDVVVVPEAGKVSAVSTVNLVSGDSAQLSFTSTATTGVIAVPTKSSPSMTLPEFISSGEEYKLSVVGGTVTVIVTNAASAPAGKRKAAEEAKPVEVVEKKSKKAKTEEAAKTEDTPKKTETKATKGAEVKTESVPVKAQDAVKAKKEVAVTPAKKETKVAKDEVVKFTNGLNYKDIEIGSGPEVTRGKRVGIRYRGMLTSGYVFDENMPRGQLLEFTVGKGEVITGMDMAMLGMKRGGKRRMIIPSNLGYGEAGVPDGSIPPRSTLIFDVSLERLH